MPRSLPANVGQGLTNAQIATLIGEILLGIVTDGLDVPAILVTLGYDYLADSTPRLLLEDINLLMAITNNFLSIIKSAVELGIDVKNLFGTNQDQGAFYCKDAAGNRISIACILQAINSKLTAKDKNNSDIQLADILYKWKEDFIFVDANTNREYAISETLGRLLLTGYLVPRG